MHLSSRVFHRVHGRRGSDRRMHDALMWPVGRTSIIRWKRMELQKILLEWFLTCAVMTKTLVFKTKKTGNGDKCKVDDEYPGYARIKEEED